MAVTPSHIIEYLFCPRFTWFEYVMNIPQYEERHYKVEKGRYMHELKLVQNKDYLRKKIGATSKLTDQYLANDLLRGQVDEVLTLEDGSMAPLDYKYAQFKDILFQTYRTQLACYAVLIEDNFNRPVNRGYLVYVRSNNHLETVEIATDEKEEVKEACNKVVEIILNNFYPKATKYKARCVTCTYRNICTK